MEQLYYEKVNKALDNLTLRTDKVSKFIGFSESPGTRQKDKGRLYIDFEDGLGNYKALPFSLPALEIVFEGEGSTFKELVEAVKVKYEKRALYYYLKEEETESDKMYKELKRLFLNQPIVRKGSNDTPMVIDEIIIDHNGNLQGFNITSYNGLTTKYSCEELSEFFCLTLNQIRFISSLYVSEELREKYSNGVGIESIKMLFLASGVETESGHRAEILDIREQGKEELLIECFSLSNKTKKFYNTKEFIEEFKLSYLETYALSSYKSQDREIISGVKKEPIKERLERDLLDLHFSKENGGESFNKDIEEVNKRFKGRSFEHTKQKGERATFKGLVKGDKQYLVTLEDGEVVCRTTIEGFLDIYDVCKADRDFLIKRSKFTESVPITPNIKEKPTISKESEEFLDGDSFQILKYLFLNQTLTSIGGAKGKVTNITKGARDYRIWVCYNGQGESVSHPLKYVRNQFELTNVQEVALNKIIGRMDVMKEEVKITTLEEAYTQLDYKEVFSKVDLSKQALKLPDNIYDKHNRKILLLI